MAAGHRKQATLALYSNLLWRHLEPEPFGAIRLDKLKPSDVEALVLAMRVKTKGEPPRGDSTIRQTYTVLRAGVDGSVRDGLLARNPAAAVKRLGGPVDPRNLLRVVEVAAKAAKGEGVGVHTLRHSAAVAWLEASVHIKAADLLGHSSVAVAGDIYGEVSNETRTSSAPEAAPRRNAGAAAPVEAMAMGPPHHQRPPTPRSRAER